MADNVTIDGITWATKDISSAHHQLLILRNELGAYIAFAEDVAAADGAYGIPILGKRKDASGSDVGTDGDWQRLLFGSLGGAKVELTAPAMAFAFAERTTAGTTSIVGAAGAGLKIKVVNYQIVTETPNGVHLLTGSTSITGLMELGRGISRAGSREAHLMETTANAALQFSTDVSGQVAVQVGYIVAA